MTLGEKLKAARTQHGLTQQELAERLCVSRAAVAKWESGKGLPDTANLQAISRLLDVSIDYLLADEDDAETPAFVLREAYDPAAFRRKGDVGATLARQRAVHARYPKASITPLSARIVLTKADVAVDEAISLATIMQPAFIHGVPQLLNGIKLMRNDEEFCLVDDADGSQYFVKMGPEFLEITQLAAPITERKFRIGDMEFTSGGSIAPDAKRLQA